MSETPQPAKRRFNRRFWIKSAACAAASGTGLLGWAVVVEPRWMSISYQTVKVANLPSQWQGRRLIHISDMHIGKVSVGYLQSAMHQVNALQPDLLAITGDFIDHTGGLGDELTSVLAELEPAKLGTVACLGNHDYGFRWSQLDIADRVVDTATKFGIQVLRDDRIHIDGLDVIGLDDFWSPRCHAQPVLKRVNPEAASLCLCHNPDLCDRHDWSAFHGLVLAGHTHGGQCKPPFLPPPILPVQNRRYTSGLFDLNPGRQLFITRGLGHTHRVRFNCRPEISVFDLQSA